MQARHPGLAKKASAQSKAASGRSAVSGFLPASVCPPLHPHLPLRRPPLHPHLPLRRPPLHPDLPLRRPPLHPHHPLRRPPLHPHLPLCRPPSVLRSRPSQQPSPRQAQQQRQLARWAGGRAAAAAPPPPPPPAVPPPPRPPPAPPAGAAAGAAPQLPQAAAARLPVGPDQTARCPPRLHRNDDREGEALQRPHKAATLKGSFPAPPCAALPATLTLGLADAGARRQVLALGGGRLAHSARGAAPAAATAALFAAVGRLRCARFALLQRRRAGGGGSAAAATLLAGLASGWGCQLR